MLFVVSTIAYIGPGGGIVVTGMLLSVLAALLGVLFIILCFPVIAAWSSLFGRKQKSRYTRYTRYTRYNRVIILGIDGMDPEVAARLMDCGKLPHLESLKKRGSYHKLQVSAPAISPAAWSSFATGKDASYHGIYDFISRDCASYSPALSSYSVKESSRLSGSYFKFLRKGISFWKFLSGSGVESTVLRVPISFPPEKVSGRLLSGMCMPDAIGTQGIYTLISEKDTRKYDVGAGQFAKLKYKNNKICAEIEFNKLVAKGHGSKKVTVYVRKASSSEVLIKVSGNKFRLRLHDCSEWMQITVPSETGTAEGIVRFYLSSVEPFVSIYMTPVSINPSRPLTKISHPLIYSDYLARKTGQYGTLGLLEDTNALNEGALDSDGFLTLSYKYYEERKRMWNEILKQDSRGASICVFDTLDRIQHMFWRDLTRGTANNPIEQYYMEFDRLVGQTLGQIDHKTLFMVISDHGFTSFDWGINLNTWLYENGYLHYKDGSDVSEPWLNNVDWSKTRAYSMGLAGIFLNLAGRESGGIVKAGEPADSLMQELQCKLQSLTHALDGQKSKPIRRVLICTEEFEGPYKSMGPDLLIGYDHGYRSSWENARGITADNIIEKNTRPWSGDHCVDPQLVPGVLFANQPLDLEGCEPSMLDIAPTVCSALGVDVSGVLPGRVLLKDASRKTRRFKESCHV